MGFISFVGRVLFASVFLLSAYQEFNEFGTDGGPALNALKPKYKTFANHVTAHSGLKIPEFDLKSLVASAIVLKGVGGLFFILSSYLGASLLIFYLIFATPILYDFYNYEIVSSEYEELFAKFILNLVFLGALFFFVGMKNSIPKRISKKDKKKTN